MSVTVKVPYYSSLCDSFMYGKKILDLPEKIVDAIDDYFDGQVIDFSGWANPDNVFINSLTTIDPKEVLVDITKMLTNEEYQEYFVEYDGVDEFIELRLDEIIEKLNDNFTFLGYVSGDFYVFQ